jgi:hypothetical protein
MTEKRERVKSQLRYLASILAALGVSGADHALGDVEVAVLQPLVAQVAVQDRDFHLVHCRLVL